MLGSAVKPRKGGSVAQAAKAHYSVASRARFGKEKAVLCVRFGCIRTLVQYCSDKFKFKGEARRGEAQRSAARHGVRAQWAKTRKGRFCGDDESTAGLRQWTRT
jgi:hypothetical protein